MASSLNKNVDIPSINTTNTSIIAYKKRTVTFATVLSKIDWILRGVASQDDTFQKLFTDLHGVLVYGWATKQVKVLVLFNVRHRSDSSDSSR